MRAINPKLLGGGVAAAVTTVVVWVLRLNGLTTPPEVATALTVLIGAVAGYMIPDRNTPRTPAV
jgi:hypothetical protein